MLRRQVAWFPALIVGVLAAGGCDGTPRVSGSEAEATVSGVVTLQGKPVDGGTVTFNPANLSRKDAAQRSAPIGKDGRYTITTLVGGNVATPVIPNIGRRGDLRRAQKSIEVASGTNSLDIDIPPFPGPPKR